MKWEDRGQSRNVEDRRASRGPARTGASLGIGGLIIIGLISLLTGTNLFSFLGIGPGTTTPPPTQESLDAEQEQVSFVSFVLDDVQGMWTQVFAASDVPWQDAQLVLYRDAVASACGNAPSAVGPFYCPLDGDLYIDLSFYDELRTRFGAPGDFAEAYVIAHELGHHVQNLLGIMQDVQEAQQLQPAAAGALSVGLELQADCFAGVWAASAHARGIMERGDLEEGQRAAASVGDDTLQRRTTGSIRPESFTHGTSAQREQWFTAGFEAGSPDACDTFAAL
jgi:predicted metalloprotease